jgi:GWxTD domain-containing protein
MFQTKLRTVAALVSIAVLVGSASFVFAQDELKGKDLRWMEEDVAALITQEEINIYQAIAKDDRKLFREIFWSRRDTNPATDDNEFEKDFESRRKQADKQFKANKVKGYATDMGIVWLLLGEPASKEGSTWVYNANPDMGIPDGLTIKFNGNTMEASQDVVDALELVKQRHITNQMIQYVRNLEGKLLEPRKTDPNSPSNLILTALRETQTPSSDIPFETQIAYFRASAGSIYIPILYELDGNALTWNGDKTAITAFGMVENEQGFPIYQYEEPDEIAKANDGRTLYDVPVQLQPGKYKLYVGVRDNTTSAAGTQIIDLDVPDFYASELIASSVLVYNHAEQVVEPAGTPGHSFQFGPVQFQPADQFVMEDTIGVFAFIYGMGRDASGNADLTGQFIFTMDGERKGATREQPLKATEEQAIVSTEIEFASIKAFVPGNYKLQIKVKDKITNKTLTEEVEFVLTGNAPTQ